MDLEWQKKAACYKAYPPVDMICMGMGKPAAWLIRDFCNHCVVVKECGAHALNMKRDQLVGIWGGVYIPLPNNGRFFKRRTAIAKLAAIVNGQGDDA